MSPADECQWKVVNNGDGDVMVMRVVWDGTQR